MHKPIKRHEALQPVSREHHFGLLLSWKIRQGFKQNIEVKRIKSYTDWFWEHHLIPHFNFEEQYMFPILGNNHKLIKRAIKEHKRLGRLFTATNKIEQNLSLIEEELIAHIRFEERILFKEIQGNATKQQLEIIEQEHEKVITEEWQDQFWLKQPKAN